MAGAEELQKAVLGVAVAAILLVLFCVRWGGTDPRPLQHDEHITLLAITGHQLDLVELESDKTHGILDVQSLQSLDPSTTVGNLLEGLRTTDVHPPMYFLLAQRWLVHRPELLRSPEAVDTWLRLLSGLFVGLTGTLLVCRAFWVGCWGSGGCGLLLGIGTYPLLQAQNARPYGLLLLLASLSLLVSLEIRERPRGRGLPFLLGLLLAAGLLTHYLFLPLATGLLIGLSIERELRPKVAGSALLAAACCLPWFWYAGAQPWGPPAHLLGAVGATDGLHLLGQNIGRYLGVTGLPTSLARPVPWILATLVLGGTLAALGGRGGRRPVVGLGLLLPLAGPWLVDMTVGTNLLASPHSTVCALPVLGWGFGLVGEAAWNSRARLPALVGGLALTGMNLAPLQGPTPEPWLELRSASEDERDEDPLVILDTNRRGRVLRGLRYMRSSGEVIALHTSELDNHGALLQERDSVWLISCCGPGTRERARERQEQLVRAGFAKTRETAHPEAGWSRWTR